MVERVARDTVVAYRLGAHHLTERVSEDLLSAVAGTCGVQNSPPGSALLALHARMENLGRAGLDAAIEGRQLLQTWSMRGAPFYVPTADAAVFTTGVLPPSEDAVRHFLLGLGPAVDELGMSVAEAVDLTRSEVENVLSGRRLVIGPLGAEIGTRIAAHLPPRQRATWEAEGPYAAGQPLGEAVVHFCLRVLTLEGMVCFAPREGNKAPFVLVEEWLGQALPAMSAERARAELLRRHLHSYGPSTRAGFAAWLGVRAGDVDPWWSLMADELTEVDYGGSAWLLTEDLDGLHAARVPTGVRLLPPRDPYTQARDRETLVDKAHHRQVWTTVGDPGTVLIDGAIVGTWRPRKRGRTLTVSVTPFDALADRHRRAIEEAAEAIGPLRGAASVETTFLA